MPTMSPRAARKLVADGVEAIAVCFLFAYANPAHEKAAAEIIRDIAPHLYVSLSHEVNPEWREYERTASTVANAYIGPPVSRYLHELEELSLQRFPRSRALMMKSDGGAGSAAHAGADADPDGDVGAGRRRHRQPPSRRRQGHRQPHHLRCRRHQLRHGGAAGPAAVQVGVRVARHPLRTHTVDIETIGAGGGSIASVAARRRAQGRAAERRRLSGAGLLRPRRQSSRR